MMNHRQLLQVWRTSRIMFRQCAVKVERVPAAVRITTHGPPTSVSSTNDNENNNVVVTGLDELLREQATNRNEAYRKSVPFDDVPGPLVLKNIGTLWSYVSSYLSIFGDLVVRKTYLLNSGIQFRWRDNMYLFKYLVGKYGPVVRIHGPLGGNILLLSRPEHAAIVFENEGPYPVRSSLDCLEKYRLEHRQYRQAGPYVMYGPEWERLRKNMEMSMKGTDAQRQRVRSRQVVSVLFQKQIETACDELMQRILLMRNRQFETSDLYPELYKWCVECLFSVAFHKRLGCLDLHGLSTVSEPNMLLQGLTGTTNAIRRCEAAFRLWRFAKTPAWTKLVDSLGEIESILDRHVRDAQEVIGSKQKGRSILESAIGVRDPSMVECLLLGDAMLQEDVLTILLDMFIIGVNLTAHSLSFLLYHIARNPRVQRKLHTEISEVSNVIPVHRRPYMRACMRESMRLKPPMPVLSRTTTRDMSVHGYQIPSGTQLLIATHLSSISEEHFDDAARFRPERWLVDAVDSEQQHALASIPFGRGPKACVAQELAQMQMGVLVAKVLQRFRVEYHYADLFARKTVLAVPDRRLRFRFVDRD